MLIAVRHAQALVDPVRRVFDAPREVGEVPIAAHDAEQRVLRAIDDAAAEGGADLGRIARGERIERGRLLVADHAAVGHAVGTGLEAHLPEADVGAEIGERHAGGARRFVRVAHLLGPVLVVGEHHHQARARHERGVGVHVEIGGVGDVVAVGLEVRHRRHGAIEEVAALAADVERAIERHFVAVARHQAEARVDVERLAVERVVRLIGVRRQHGEHVDGAAIAHDERREASAAVGELDAREVDARDPVAADGDGEGRAPGALDHAGGAVDGRVGLLADGRRARGDHAAAFAGVVAEAIDLPGGGGHRRRRGLHADGVAVEDGERAHVEVEGGIAGAEVGVPQVVARLLVLVPHEVGLLRRVVGIAGADADTAAAATAATGAAAAVAAAATAAVAAHHHVVAAAAASDDREDRC